MADAPLMVGVSGLRGIVGKSLTPEVAAKFAQAFGLWLRDRAGYQVRVCIGRDGRAGGEALERAAIEGLASAGADVETIGVAMTPTIGFAVNDYGFDGGMVVTASHNPQEWNGLKCIVADPAMEPRQRGGNVSAPNAGQAQEIMERFNQSPPQLSIARGTVRHMDEVVASYLGHMTMGYYGMEAGRRLDRLGYRVVLDSVNCSGAGAGSDFLSGYAGCKLIHLNADHSGIFPHNPEPTRENLGDLCRAVRESGAAIGFAQDPDGDRLAIVDERGEYIGEEYTLALCAASIMVDIAANPQHFEGTDWVLVTNLSTSRMIDDVAERYGARVVRTPVGEANVVEGIRREKAAGARAAMAGEGNGGVINPFFLYIRDSVAAMMYVLALMARTGEKVSELVADLPRYAIEKRKVDLARKEDAAPAVEKIARAYSSGPSAGRIDRQDGVRVDWDGPLPGGGGGGGGAGKAWVHVRASNTEPIMRLIAEAPTADQAKRILDEVGRVAGK